MILVALYARYSCDQQREASIGDRLRICRLYAEKQGWIVAESYHDRAVSGASLSPPFRVAPYPGAPGYEAVDTCLASPEVRARAEGVIESF